MASVQPGDGGGGVGIAAAQFEARDVGAEEPLRRVKGVPQ